MVGLYGLLAYAAYLRLLQVICQDKSSIGQDGQSKAAYSCDQTIRQARFAVHCQETWGTTPCSQLVTQLRRRTGWMQEQQSTAIVLACYSVCMQSCVVVLPPTTLSNIHQGLTALRYSSKYRRHIRTHDCLCLSLRSCTHVQGCSQAADHYKAQSGSADQLRACPQAATAFRHMAMLR